MIQNKGRHRCFGKCGGIGDMAHRYDTIEEVEALWKENRSGADKIRRCKHPQTEANSYIYHGSRRCRDCIRINDHKYRQRKRRWQHKARRAA